MTSTQLSAKNFPLLTATGAAVDLLALLVGDLPGQIE
jgi:hypothetical protein